MDKNSNESSGGGITYDVFEKEDRCVNCSTTRHLQQYDGDTYCPGCLNQYLVIQ